ncbi:ATP-binding protein [Streptomyces caniscabiei]|uniref:ATP-binding protein n=1 Tax=Streptomyces caniscabiei TaxID=2746961 RepID=A0ABU4MXU8_9ACTN|nr:ATP-binding protein [Streptomyces caniscabiei]MBE4741418.1 ATP-binding protein [Streptomyces caniscabiei]MBE4761608.1 ATP-binding protein [Streptomyces caniscabiei]MBE4789980.1 ATP-binding protein [Streptomyces caniscabiei]MBE4799257.1 ATP-binding protein [Streptomyces caniscabiei]MDX2947677.1 ATP-binding protein [Streptomyces caniscabiei]
MSRPFEESPYAFTVPPLVEAVPAARDRIVSRARGLGLALNEELAQDLKLLTGELVANSVMHTRAACVVSVRWTGQRLRVEVTDVDPTTVRPSQARSADENGRGLFLVAALATEWGSHPCAAGKKTWFELTVPTSVGDTKTGMPSHAEAPADHAVFNRAVDTHSAGTEPAPIASACTSNCQELWIESFA